MIPAFFQTPMLAFPPSVAVHPMAAGTSHAVDFGAMLLAQPGVQQDVVPAAQQTETKVPAFDAKLAEIVPVENVSEAANPASPAEQQPSDIVSPLPNDVGDPLSGGVENAEIPSMNEARIAIAELVTPPVAPVPQVVSAATLPPQHGPVPRFKSASEEAIKVAAVREVRVPVTLEVLASMPVPVETVPAPAALLADPCIVTAKSPVSDPVAQVSERVLDMARGSDWLDQLAGDIMVAKEESRDLRFRLNPPQLGQLDVRIETHDAGLQLDFAAQTDEATQIITAAQPRLVEELRNQGVRVAGSDVATATGQHSSGGQRQPQSQPQNAPQFVLLHPPAKQIAPAQSGRFA